MTVKKKKNGNQRSLLMTVKKKWKPMKLRKMGKELHHDKQKGVNSP